MCTYFENDADESSEVVADEGKNRKEPPLPEPGIIIVDAKPGQESREDWEETERSPEPVDKTSQDSDEWKDEKSRLWCPECGKHMKTGSQFSLSQHLWQVHPECEEAKRRSRDHETYLQQKKMQSVAKYNEEQAAEAPPKI